MASSGRRGGKTKMTRREESETEIQCSSEAIETSTVLVQDPGLLH
jgi:hypothetical protein